MTPLDGNRYEHPGDLLGCEDYEGHPEIQHDEVVPFKWVRTMLACTTVQRAAEAALQLELNVHEGSLEVLQHAA